jgi:RHS repeat-associated protein
MASIAAGGGAPAGTIIDGNLPGSLGNNVFPFPGQLVRDGDNGTGPKAYLNYLLFDRDYVYKTGGFKRLTTAAIEQGTDVTHERLFFDNNEINITEAGYLYIWLSNENDTPVEVYFDDLKVTQVKSPVIQSDDYYPFGLTFNSYSRENSVPNKFKFQEQEHIDDLGLNWDSFKWRNHQPDIGRFFNVDPLAEKYVYWSPYAFSGNQVVNARELEGLEPYIVTGRSFIPSKTVSNPMPLSNTKSFKGDDRSFDPKATSYRTEQKVRVDFDNKKVSLLNNTASGSTGLDSKGNVTETSAAGKAGPTPTYDKGAMEKGSTTINMQVDATNELATGAPAINYDVNITITPQEDGSVNYNMTGASDGFPAYEFYITDEATGKSTMMHGSNPQKTGDTPYSLFPPMEKTINKSGNTNDKKKPE